MKNYFKFVTKFESLYYCIDSSRNYNKQTNVIVNYEEDLTIKSINIQHNVTSTSVPSNHKRIEEGEFILILNFANAKVVSNSKRNSVLFEIGKVFYNLSRLGNKKIKIDYDLENGSYHNFDKFTDDNIQKFSQGKVNKIAIIVDNEISRDDYKSVENIITKEPFNDPFLKVNIEMDEIFEDAKGHNFSIGSGFFGGSVLYNPHIFLEKFGELNSVLVL